MTNNQASLRQSTPLFVAATLLLLAVIWIATRPAGWHDPLTPRERQWLSAHVGTIRIAATPSNKPLEYFDAEGRYQGMVADYVTLLEKKLRTKFTVVQSKNLTEVLEKAKNREVDMISAFAANPARVDFMHFTRPFLELPTVILVNKSQHRFLTLETMQDMDLALPKEYAVLDYIEKYHSDIHVQPVYNYLAALLHVSFDEIDATIISLPQASYYIKDKGITNLRVAGHTDFKIYNRIAVRSDWPMLSRIIQKGLDSITPQEKERIFRKWVTLDQNYVSFFLQNKRFWYWVGAGILAVVLLLVAIISWNRTLQRRVRERTDELERELQARVQLLTAIEQTEDGIFILDTSGVIEYANPAFSRMSGYSKQELVGQHCAIIRSDRQDSAFYNDLWASLRNGEVWRGHSTYQRKDGALYEVDASVSPIFGHDGSVINYVEVTRDITEQRQLEEQLRQSQKMEELGTLAGGIAHDFNNFIAAILGYAELALLKTEPGSRAHTNLENISKVGRRAKEMVNQILIFSRRREPERRLVELAPVLDEVLDMLETTMPATIEVHRDIHARGRTVLADPTQIHQIIMNLGTNAGYAMGKSGGELTVSLTHRQIDAASATPKTAPGPYLQLTVTDTGPGIPGDILGRIFDPFFTTKPQGKGTGMGLSMVHGMVGSIGGTISVTSTQGAGTTFTVLLPETDTDPHAPRRDARQVIPGSGTILVVDDEQSMVDVLQQMLEDLGYTVHTTTDSHHALTLFATHSADYDLVISDQTMPRMTGERLAEELVAIRADIPIIISTGFSDRIRHITKGENGIRKILLKPFDLAVLSQAIHDVLEHGETLGTQAPDAKK
ncbi:hypothetical protein JCM16814_01890 [Desulfobaculum senezii]